MRYLNKCVGLKRVLLVSRALEVLSMHLHCKQERGARTCTAWREVSFDASTDIVAALFVVAAAAAAAEYVHNMASPRQDTCAFQQLWQYKAPLGGCAALKFNDVILTLIHICILVLAK